MAEECAESSSPAPASNWWDLHGQASLGLSSWCNNDMSNNNNNNSNNNITWPHLGMPNPNSNNSDEDVSITTSFTSNHSGLTVESSTRLIDPPERTGSDQIWSQVFSNIGSNEGDNNNNNNMHQDVGENFLNMLSSSKNMFESNYLKKLDGSTNWDDNNHHFSNPNFLNNNNNNNNHLQNNSETKLSNLINTWSIAPPENHRRGISTNNNTNMIGENIDKFNKYHINNSYDQIINPVVDSYISGEGSAKNSFADVISFSGRLSNSFTDHIIHDDNNDHHNKNNNKSCGATKSSSLSDSKKQGHLSSSSSPPMTKSTGRSGNSTSSNEGKKKRNEEDNSNNSETNNLKKPKQEGSTASSTKVQAPKVKLGDKITALQQIVSPFGKTDTASVLYEAIQYIKFLEEQIQLFSNPYMKTKSHKSQWGSFERKADHVIKADHNNHNLLHHRHIPHRLKVDLRSQGLCLVPVLCTPQVYRENTGSDFWTPTYRGCLYR